LRPSVSCESQLRVHRIAATFHLTPRNFCNLPLPDRGLVTIGVVTPSSCEVSKIAVLVRLEGRVVHGIAAEQLPSPTGNCDAEQSIVKQR
ncbi:MAG TPA: hypothetical protein VNA21_12270, partial [Steroidobacteraceae bacterium]|nr:hypothetical protein [Steroidobacteraceae bacterium]